MHISHTLSGRAFPERLRGAPVPTAHARAGESGAATPAAVKTSANRGKRGSLASVWVDRATISRSVVEGWSSVNV